MKSITLSLLLVLFIGFSAQSQEKVKERDLKGQWKMVFDFDEDFIEEELDLKNIPWFGRMVAESVSGFVFNILEEIDLQFEFQPDHRLKIIVEVFGEREVDYAHWHSRSDVFLWSSSRGCSGAARAAPAGPSVRRYPRRPRPPRCRSCQERQPGSASVCGPLPR